MSYTIHPKDMVRILEALDERDCQHAARIASDLRNQFEQILLPVTREVRERPKLRMLEGGVK